MHGLWIIKQCQALHNNIEVVYSDLIQGSNKQPKCVRLFKEVLQSTLKENDSGGVNNMKRRSRDDVNLHYESKAPKIIWSCYSELVN